MPVHRVSLVALHFLLVTIVAICLFKKRFLLETPLRVFRLLQFVPIAKEYFFFLINKALPQDRKLLALLIEHLLKPLIGLS